MHSCIYIVDVIFQIASSFNTIVMPVLKEFKWLIKIKRYIININKANHGKWRAIAHFYYI